MRLSHATRCSEIRSGELAPHHRLGILEPPDEVEVRVRSGLLEEQGVDAPAAVDPNRAAAVERAQQLKGILGSDRRGIRQAAPGQLQIRRRRVARK